MNIVIEGLDGVGKSAVAEAIAREVGADVVTFPDDAGPAGAEIRAYLRGEWGVIDPRVDGHDDRVEALAFQALHALNKAARLRELALTALSPVRHAVVCRYWPSTWVYGQLDGLPRALNEAACCLDAVAPARAYLLLDAPPEVCLARRAARDGALAPERYERKLDLYGRAAALYRELWALTPRLKPGAWRVVDAGGPLVATIEQARQALGLGRVVLP